MRTFVFQRKGQDIEVLVPEVLVLGPDRDDDERAVLVDMAHAAARREQERRTQPREVAEDGTPLPRKPQSRFGKNHAWKVRPGGDYSHLVND